MGEQGPVSSAGVALVGVGGFLGSILRHGVTMTAPTTAVGTLAVNVVGSFALALVLSDSRVGRWITARARLLLATGLLSSFTTYSTFALATTELAPMMAVGYVATNYALAILAVLLVQWLARWSE